MEIGQCEPQIERTNLDNRDITVQGLVVAGKVSLHVDRREQSIRRTWEKVEITRKSRMCHDQRAERGLRVCYKAKGTRRTSVTPRIF